MAGFAQRFAAKRYIARLRRDFPLQWGLGIEQAEKHFREKYRLTPPRSPSSIPELMELADSEASAYIPSLVIQTGGDLDEDAMQAFCTAFQRRLSELFIGIAKGKLLNA